MKAQLQKQLFEKYPNLFADKDKPMTQTAMVWGIDCDDGWYDLINRLCAVITKLNPEIKASQVKEKYGTLRFYTVTSDDTVDDAIFLAERASESLCETCGRAGENKRIRGWWKTSCKEHE